MAQQGQQLAQTPQANAALQKFNSVAKLLQSDAVQSAIARALPKHLTAERMIRVAMTALQKVPKLAECDQRSLINAIIQSSELGLEPNTPLQHAYLIPYWNSTSKRTEAQLMVGYRGLIALARRSDQVSGIYAEIVYEHDYFEIDYGLDKNLVHKPALNLEDRGKMIGAYAVAKFKDGYTDFEYMNAAEIAKIRARSKSPDKGPWVTDEGEMWRKTPIRRLSKRLPLSIEDATLQKAIEIDKFHDAGFDNIAPLEIGDGSPSVISEEQRVAIVEAARTSGADLAAILASEGFELVAHVTADRYADILAAVSTGPAEPEVAHTDAQVGEVVTEQEEIVDATAPDDEADPGRSEESKLEDLRIAAIEVYRSLTGKRKTEANGFLGTQEIKDLDAAGLQSFVDTFSG